MTASPDKQATVPTKPAPETATGGQSAASVAVGAKAPKLSKKNILLGIGAALIVLILLGLGWHLYNDHRNVTIGSITITPQQVNELSDEIASYTKKHKDVGFGGTPHKVARDELILNAALKKEAATHHITVSRADIEAAQTTQYESYGSKANYEQFVKANGMAQHSKITAENQAYEAKLSDVLLAKKNLFVAAIIYDTPYVNNSTDSAGLRTQALQTMQNKFLPLFQQGKSDTEIAAQTDINPKKPVSNPGSSSAYFTSMPSVSFNATGCTTAKPCFNDTKSKPLSGLPAPVSTQSVIDKLDTVGQNSGVVNTEAGFVGILQLTGKTDGSYSSWNQFLQSYENKYAKDKLLAFSLLPRSQIQWLATHSLAHYIGKAGNHANNIIFKKAAADPSCTDNSSHFVQLNIHAYNQNGGNLSGVHVTETRAHAACPNAGGRYIDNESGPNHGINAGNTNGNGSLSFNDNCYNSDPNWTQAGPGGSSLAWVHVSDSLGDDATTVVGNGGVTEGNAIDKAINESNIWRNGVLNVAGSLNIELHYVSGWTLDGQSIVSDSSVHPGQTVTFRHQVRNNGPASAHYTWIVKDSNNPNGSYNNHGLPTGSPNNVARNDTSPDLTTYGSTYGKARYTVPNNAQSGDKYCQRIYYSNANGAGTAEQRSSEACVTVGGGGNAPSSCTSITIYDEGGYNVSGGSNNPRPTQTHVRVYGFNPNGGSPPSPYYGTEPGIDTVSNHTPIGNGQHRTWNGLIPTSSVIYIQRIRQWQSTGGVWNNYSSTLEAIPCYSSQCSISIDGVIPGDGNGVVAGQQFTVRVSVGNNGPGGLPNSITGHNFSLNNGDVNGNGSDWGFAVDLNGMGHGDPPQTKSFTLTAPNDTNAHVIKAHTAYSGLFAMAGGDCAVPVNVYKHFTLKPTASSELSPTDENPTRVDYPIGVIQQPDQFTGGILAGLTGTLYRLPAGGSSSPVANAAYSGTYVTTTYNSPPPSWTITGGLTAGDRYCAQSTVNPATGWMGPYGIRGGAPDTSPTSCDTVTNKPYFKVYGSGASAGVSLKKGDGTCNTSNGGLLAGWNNNTGGQERGAGSQLSSLALVKITGFASAQSGFNVNTGIDAAKLAFANNGPGVDKTVDAEDPALGGNFNATGYCINSVTPPISGVGSTTLPGGSSYGGASNITDSRSVFVNGDVTITGNVTYGATGSVDNAPSFVLKATGKIRIAPNVTKLDGIYMSEEKIYTCADSSGPITSYSTCKNQLLVHGSFVADQIKLGRTFGSLRDEEPNPGTPAGSQIGLVWSCGGGECNPALGGLRCTNINETSDIHTWHDNKLCVPNSSPVQLAWTRSANSGILGSIGNGVTNGTASLNYLQTHGYPHCTAWNVSDPDGWNDNYLCSNTPGLNFRTTNDPAQYCTRIVEPTDPHGNWASGNFLCEPKASPGSGPTPKGPPFNSCNNAGIQATVQSCASEVFEFSPELFLSTPAIQPPNNGAPQWDAVTGLPPVL
jgi:hypothetical protein